VLVSRGLHGGVRAKFQFSMLTWHHLELFLNQVFLIQSCPHDKEEAYAPSTH
jgi:hypothetical protein